MPDITISCSECQREHTVSEYVSADSLVCLTCGANLTVPRDTGSTGGLKMRKQGPIAPPPLQPAMAGAAAVDPNSSSIFVDANQQVGARKRDDTVLGINVHQAREKPKNSSQAMIFLPLLLIAGSLIGFQYKSDDLSGYLNFYIWARNAIAVVSYLLLLIVAYQDGIGQGSMCLFIPPYTLLYAANNVESNLLRGAFFGMILALAAEVYLLPDYSVLLLIGARLNEFISYVDSMIVRASE